MKILLVLRMVAVFGLWRAARPCALRGDSFKPLPIAMLLWRGWFMRAACSLSFADIVLREWIRTANISRCCQWRLKMALAFIRVFRRFLALVFAQDRLYLYSLLRLLWRL